MPPVDNSMGGVKLEVTVQVEPMRAHCGALCLKRIEPEDVGCVSHFAKFHDKEMPTVPLKPHQESASARVIHMGVVEEFRILLDRFHLPKICLRNRDLKVSYSIVIAQPKVLSPSVFIGIGKDCIEEEDNVVAG